jgi:hypothetical protein
MIAKSLPLAGKRPVPGRVRDQSTTPTGPLQYDSFHLDRDRAEVVKVHLNMGAGKLQAGSGTDKLLQAYFTYNVAALEAGGEVRSGRRCRSTRAGPNDVHFHPGRVDYRVGPALRPRHASRFRRELRCRRSAAGPGRAQPARRPRPDGRRQNGAGPARAPATRLRRAHRGRHRRGRGAAALEQPASTPQPTGGIGEDQGPRSPGSKDDHWENDAWPTAKVKVNVDVQGGIGSISLIGDSN